MAKGRLSNVEKYAIQGMVGQDATVAEIASELGRSEKTVENYVNNELDRLHSMSAEIQLRQAEDEEVAKKSSTDESVIKKVVRRLLQAGLTEMDAQRVMNSALARAEKKNKVYGGEKAVDLLYNDCIGRMTASQFMIKKSQGGREGVAIMTPGASQKGDGASKRNRNQTTRSSKGNLFNIKQNRMIDE